MKRTIPTLLRRTVEEVPEKLWLLAGDEQYTYGEALDRIERGASALRASGIGVGDRVLVTARNTAEYLLNWFALMEVGAIQVPVNPASSQTELDGFAAQVSPHAVVTDADLARAVGTAVERHTAGATHLDISELFDTVPDGKGPADTAPEDVAVMIPTSGTTGRSKLVMQTHLAYVMAGEGFPFWMQLANDDRLMTALPLFHINAPAYSTLGSVAARASLVLLPRFSASTFLDSARHYAATEFNTIGAMLEILMRQPPRDDDADTPLRLCYTGPSPDKQRHLEIEARFGIEVVCGYGLSESPYGLIWPHGARPYGALGAPRQHPELGHVNDARVVDEGREVGIGEVGEVGELELRNPAIMRGYYEMPDETDAVLVDGWLRTGDLVRANADGTFTFVGRKKEVIRRRGENLSPAEVEAVLERHPAVAEAAVIGVPSDLSEEEIKAFVVPVGRATVDVDELHRFATEALTRFKVPRYFEVVGELPHTPTGRLAKHALPTERTPEEVDMEKRTTSPAESNEPKRISGGSDDDPWLHTRVGSASPDRITVAGRDLATEVMGRLTLTELAYLLLTGRDATSSVVRVLDAVLVSLADHGLTPSALASRFTVTGAPEAPQAAVAAGLLGAGSVFLGPTGDTAEFLAAALAGHAGEVDDTSLRRLAEETVRERTEAGERVPGLGHPVHRDEDPRVPRLYEIASEEGLLGPHLRLLEFVAQVHREVSGKHLPVNGAGAGGAALADAGIPPSSARAFVLIARTAGLVAHLAEEAEHPLGRRLWLDIDARASDR